MQVIETAADLQKFLTQNPQKTVGFVPTMGCLHAGHLSLVQQARAENDLVIVSIFVNPTQFGPNEDFTKYPRTLTQDCQRLEPLQVDVVFNPTVAEMYPPEGSVRKLKADESLTNVACGIKRPGHFDGVVTVVARLFDLVKPHKAYFGLKDYQQYLVIKKMTIDQQYPIEVIGCPLIRESDGLAMSSRNIYLSKTERQDALVLYHCLHLAQKMVMNQEYAVQKIKTACLAEIQKVNTARLDYLEILNKNDLSKIETIKPGQTIMLLAVFIGSTRLIDNIFL